eukprot:scaffold3055_cov96-Isochrysis_galbana.AAC.1
MGKRGEVRPLHLVERGRLVVCEFERRQHRIRQQHHKYITPLVVQHGCNRSPQPSYRVHTLPGVGGECECTRIARKVEGRRVGGGEGGGDQLGGAAGRAEDCVCDATEKGPLVWTDGGGAATGVHL